MAIAINIIIRSSTATNINILLFVDYKSQYSTGAQSVNVGATDYDNLS